MDVQLPDGRILTGVPEGTTKEQIAQKLGISIGQPPSVQGVKPSFSGAQGDIFSAMQGATFNFGDEIAAGATAGLSKLGVLDKNITYDRALETIRGAQGKFERENPVRSIGGMVAGAIPATIAAAPLVAASIPGRLAAATGVIPRLGQAAVAGAGLGAVAGAGAGEGGPVNRAQSAALGGVVGGVTGGAFQGAAEVAKPLIRVASAVGRAIGEGTGYLSSQNAADAALLRSVQRSGRTADEIAGTMRDSKANLTVADAGGNETQRLARGVVTQPGSGSNVGVNALTERSNSRAGRLVDTFRRYVSPNDDATQTIDDLLKMRSEMARPAYQEALEANPTWTSGLERMAKDPLIQQGLNRGREIQRIEAAARNERFDPNDYILNAEKQVPVRTDPFLTGGRKMETQTSYITTPNMRSLLAARRGLDDILEESRDKTTGRLVLDARGRAIQELRRAWDAELKRASPALEKADSDFGTITQWKDAVALGRGFLRGESDITAKRLSELSPVEREYMRIGAGRELRRLVETTKDGNDAIRKFFGSSDQTKRLRVLFDNDASFDQFLKEIADEKAAQATERFVLSGSQTSNKGQDLEMLGGMPVIPTKTQMVGNALLSLGSNSRTARAEKLAPVLFSTNPDEVAAKLAQIGEKQNSLIRVARRRGAHGDVGRNALATLFASQIAGHGR